MPNEEQISPATAAAWVIPEYECHKKVRAAKIAMVNGTDLTLLLPGLTVSTMHCEVSRDFIVKHQPRVGGYFVIYEDGYTSFSPAEAFEGGYTLVAR
jgi:hypothetical protein